MGIPVPKPVQDLVDSLQVVGLPPSGRYNLNQPLSLSLNYGKNAFDALASPKDFVLKLTMVDLPGLDVSRILNLDLGTLGLQDGNGNPAGLKLNVGTLDLRDEEGGLDGLKLDSGESTLDTDVVLKDVEFNSAELLASDVDPEVQASNALAYLIPNAAGILGINIKAAKGVLGRIKGKLQQTTSSLGSIAGRIAQTADSLGTIAGTLKQSAQNPGSITLPSVGQKRNADGELLPLGTVIGSLGEVLEAVPDVQVEWLIRDGEGQPIEDKFVVEGRLAGELGVAAPLVALLPDFVELQGAELDLVSVRQISCRITVSVSEHDSLSKVLGPFEIRVPAVQLPTVLLMARNAIGQDPHDVLIAVPKASLVTAKDQLKAPLDKATVALGMVEQALDEIRLPTPSRPPIQGLMEALGHVLEYAQLPRFAFERADKVSDLFWVGWGEWGFLSYTFYPFEDNRSSLVMIGPPGRAARCHVMKNLWERQGVFEVTLGPESFVIARNFSETVSTAPNNLPGPSADPQGRLQVVTGDPALSPTGSFENALSSYQFL